MRPQVFYNLGASQFQEASAQSGSYFQQEMLGRGLARLDWNRDGLPDAAVVHLDRPVTLLANESPSAGHWLGRELRGISSNRDAIGARIRVTANGLTQTLQICGGDGFVVSNDRRQLVGLGSSALVQQLEVIWPSGRVDQCKDLPADRAFLLVEGSAPHQLRF